MNQAKELFEIKPLKWKENNAHTWTAGIYSISEEEHSLVLEIDYDHYTNNIDVESIDKGKEIAESHRREQILKHLTKVESSDQKLEMVKEFIEFKSLAAMHQKDNHYFNGQYDLCQELLKFIESLDK